MDQATLPTFKSSPWRAIRDVVSTPNWVGNVLWLSLAFLASSIFVGYIGLYGYGAELIQRRAGRPENPPMDVDADRLGDYISKGIWPFLVFIVVQFAASLVLIVPIGGVVALAMLAASAGDGDIVFGGVILLLMPLMFIVALGVYLVITPFLIRAMVCQDFQKSFDLGWSLDFAKLMAGEMILSGIVFGLLGAAISILGTLVFCVGQIPASGIVMGGYVNLLAQWYEVYLSKGGRPAPPPEEDEIVDATIV